MCTSMRNSARESTRSAARFSLSGSRVPVASPGPASCARPHSPPQRCARLKGADGLQRPTDAWVHGAWGKVHGCMGRNRHASGVKRYAFSQQDGLPFRSRSTAFSPLSAHHTSPARRAWTCHGPGCLPT